MRSALRAKYKSQRDDKCVSKCILMRCAAAGAAADGFVMCVPKRSPKKRATFFSFRFSISHAVVQHIK